ncbi:MAG TPA: YceI family protein [Acidimicrobiales bacterium]|nr:YceI family protein [Acidimicrobiales bacterium]
MITDTTASTTLLPAGTWNIDPSHSSLGFSVRHLMISKVRGVFRTFSGTVTVFEDPFQSAVQVTFDPNSLDTGDATRDQHLRSADFFEVEKYPVAEYVSTGVRAEGDGYVLEGQLTLHGVTHPVGLAVEFDGVGGDPWGNTRAGFAATGEINRRDFGIDIQMPMETGGVVVGDKIKITIDVELVLAAS